MELKKVGEYKICLFAALSFLYCCVVGSSFRSAAFTAADMKSGKLIFAILF